MPYKILVADDEDEIVEILELYLEKDGFEVIKAGDGLEAWELLQNNKIDMAVIDIMMLNIDGFNLTKKIRKDYNIPIIILSAKKQDNDKILGLGLGADDYITKPFNPLEVSARVQAQLRRFYNLNPNVTNLNKKIIIGKLLLDPFNMIIKMDEREVQLTSFEYKILKLLMENAGKIFTKREIFESVWEDHYFGDDNTIMVHISNLREKIEPNPRKPIYLKTIRGLGYKVEKKVYDE